MIKGAIYWNNKDHFHIQINNPTEQYLKKLGEKDWLQTCGPTSGVNCVDGSGVSVKIVTPGGYTPQPEEVLTDYFNDPVNYPKFEPLMHGMDKDMGNYYPILYPMAVKEVFRAEAVYLANIKGWDRLKQEILQGYPVQLCLINPGHYVAVMAYDDEKDEMLLWDSWPGRPGNVNGGFCERMPRGYYESNTWNFMVVYKGVL